MRFSREQYLEYMTFGEFERPIFVELFGLLVGLEAEWRAQGATQEEIDLVAFDWDWVPVVNCGGDTGPRGLPTVILEEYERELIQRRSWAHDEAPQGLCHDPAPPRFPREDDGRLAEGEADLHLP